MIRFSPNPNRAQLIHWREWEEEAFQKAREENKPVILFLTAFWCRYCQRMDEGAFSDGDNIALLNAYFVAIRAEDAQRPDINTRYNLNGWPTIAFLTPEGELLAATNYLLSEDFGNLLARVYTAYQEKKGEIRSLTKTAQVTSQDANFRLSHGQLNDSQLSALTKVILDLADPLNGGYDR
jgi:uncharacterized protein